MCLPCQFTDGHDGGFVQAVSIDPIYVNGDDLRGGCYLQEYFIETGR